MRLNEGGMPVLYTHRDGILYELAYAMGQADAWSSMAKMQEQILIHLLAADQQVRGKEDAEDRED